MGFAMTLHPEKILWIRRGEGAAASGRVPENAPYFQDHFPRFPVLPGVLALEILKRIAEDYLIRKEGRQGARWKIAQYSGVRFSAYLRPGDEWEAKLEPSGTEGARMRWKGNLSSRGKLAAQAAFILEPADLKSAK